MIRDNSRNAMQNLVSRGLKLCETDLIEETRKLLLPSSANSAVC